MRHNPRDPLLFIMNMSGNQCYGAVYKPLDFTCTGRFNSASELTFKVPKKYYNSESESWEETSGYQYLVADNVIFSTDDTVYYSITGHLPRSDYAVSTPSYSNARSIYGASYNTNVSSEHFKLQQETELFDVGSNAGYTFQPLHGISTDSGVAGGLFNALPLLNSSAGRTDLEPSNGHEYRYIACEDYIPVSKGDIISLRTTAALSDDDYGLDDWNQVVQRYNWDVFYYNDDDPADYRSHAEHTGTFTKRIKVGQDGYARFSSTLVEGRGAKYSHSETNGYSYSYSYIYPTASDIKVWSGERRCTQIDLSTSNTTYDYTLQWFTITNVQEESDGINTYKTVTAMSHEIDLSKRLISLDDDTLPFYIPPAITNLVQGANWIYDARQVPSSTSVEVSKGGQILKKGILNYVLDELPGWSAGIISSNLMVRYRSVSAVDDANIYSFLVDTVASLYNCFIFFDPVNKTISALTLSDIYSGLRRESSVFLTWHNAIKTMQKENCEDARYTGLRVHAGDDTYGLGLVNPTGNSIIYDFSELIPESEGGLDSLNRLDYVPEGSSYDRTLGAAMKIWMDYYNNQCGSSSDYQIAAKELIQANLKLVKLQTRKRQALESYRSVATEFNACVKSEMGSSSGLLNKLVPERPLSPSSIKTYYKDRAKTLNRNDLYQELYQAARSYSSLSSSVSTAKSNLSTKQTSLRTLAKKLTLNPSVSVTMGTSSTMPLTVAERRDIQKFLKVGAWTYPDVTFTDEYSDTDIYDTLQDILEASQLDLSKRLRQDNYDFTIDSVNITAIEGFSPAIESLYLGDIVHVTNDDGQVATPILLEYKHDYQSPDNFEFVFTTDPKRKPLQFRFADLYGTITQASVTDSSFTFDT